jgi:hypothetical protein
MFGLLHRGELDGAVESEFEHLIAKIRGLWKTEHNEEGGHTTIAIEGMASDVIPTENDTYQLGKQEEQDDGGNFFAWTKLYLTTAIHWAGTATAALTGLKLPSFSTTFDGTHLTHQANVTATQTQIFKGPSVTLATIGGTTARPGGAASLNGVNIPTLETNDIVATTGEIPTFKVGGNDTVIQMDSQTVANNGTYVIPGGLSARGLLVITSQEDNASAIFQLTAGSGLWFEVIDPLNLFTAVAGTAGFNNVYIAAGSYTIQNLTGASRTYELVMLGSGIL